MWGEGRGAASSLLPPSPLNPGAGDPVRLEALGLVHQQGCVVSSLQGMRFVSLGCKRGLACVLQGCSLTAERERKRLVSRFTSYSCKRGA